MHVTFVIIIFMKFSFANKLKVKDTKTQEKKVVDNKILQWEHQKVKIFLLAKSSIMTCTMVAVTELN